MLLKSYKDILPASVAFIGGIIFTVGQPEISFANGLFANGLAEFTPTDRPKPQRTQGGGSRLHINNVVFTSSQTMFLQNRIL